MTNDMPPIPDSAFQPDALDGLLEAIRVRSEQFEAFLDAQPQAIPCPQHGALLMGLNRAASLAEAKPVYSCPKCEQENMLRRMDRRIAAAGIPADVRHATLANFQQDRPGIVTEKGYQGPAKFVEAALAFARGSMRNLILAGKPGIGKGHIAAALAIATIMRGKRVKWTECAALFNAYHHAYKNDATDAVVREHVTPALLVLDEIGFRELPADGEEILFAVLDGRHKHGDSTILLGNKAAKETREWLGDRISDRLRSGGVTMCYGEWESMRGKEHDGARDPEEF